ncbi:MAG: FHA domain-containing protein [Acidobacteriota bacterium]
MNIILAEIGTVGEQRPERSFDQSAILIGRDASECDIAFDNERFPMVSRKHAEFRWQDGHWFVIDLNSSYGTFLNGSQVTEPVPIAAGASIQFGVDGPIVRVVWFEAETETFEHAPEPVASLPTPDGSTTGVVNIHPTPPISSAPAAVGTSLATLEFADSSRPVFTITKDQIWLGRESDCDIIFDASSGTVSRKHASIRIENGEFVLTDNHSFNGTLVNEERIASPVSLNNGDKIRLGKGGPVVRFNSTATAAKRSTTSADPVVGLSKTIALKLDRTADRKLAGDNAPQLLMSVSFAGKSELMVGRDETCDIQLDGLQISKHHARLLSSSAGLAVEDLNSTNGVFVTGERISRRSLVGGDAVQIGSFLLRIDGAGNVGVFDTRSKTRIDVVNVTIKAKDRAAGGTVKLLGDVSFSIRPNEFVGILGPSGAGKSTLIKAMNGILPPASGNVLVNNLDLYRNFDSVKQQIGYVPQDDIIHRELSVYRTLYYIARLRLSRDASAAEIAQIIDEVLDVTGLSVRKNVQVRQLSGGQRKRVSMAVELLTKPAAIFLDEPTSGLDPSTEETIMRLFREIAESGRTVVMTTHVLENVRLFDKIVLLVAGKLVFFGSPGDALSHFGVSNFKELYEALERPLTANSGESKAEELWRKFAASVYYKKNVREPLDELGTLQQSPRGKKRRLGIVGSVSQLITLSRRYLAVLFKDKLNLLILFAQAPLIALLTYLVMDSNRPRDFVYFVVALVAFWFGISVAAREIIRERAVYKRERMFNLGIVPYLFSKLFVLGIIVTVQCLMLFAPLKLFDLTGMMSMPGEMLGVPQFWAMLLTAGVGIACGLLVSTLVRTSEMAASLVPLVLIPQILFSGLVGVPHGVNKVIGLTMPSAWSFDTMKRFSTLDTLEPDGADPKGATRGLGLYKSIEAENEKAADKAKRDLQDLKKIGGAFMDSDVPASAMPEMPELKKVPNDLSGYVSFLHPWMSEVLNQVVLMIMLGLLVFATLIALRFRDHVH